jgi:ABC-type oligopeptide transport system ATPase subunit
VINEKGIAEGLTAVLNVSLTIPDGKIVSFLGHSGCGKSSFLEILAGLQPPTDGTIHIDANLSLNPRTQPEKTKLTTNAVTVLFRRWQTAGRGEQGEGETQALRDQREGAFLSAKNRACLFRE